MALVLQEEHLLCVCVIHNTVEILVNTPSQMLSVACAYRDNLVRLVLTSVLVCLHARPLCAEMFAAGTERVVVISPLLLFALAIQVGDGQTVLFSAEGADLAQGMESAIHSWDCACATQAMLARRAIASVPPTMALCVLESVFAVMA